MSEFVDTIKKHLRESVRDAAIGGVPPPVGPAIDTCMSLARCVADIVDLHPEVKGAAFLDDDGVVSLVVSTGARRVNYSMSADGKRIHMHQIDEKMNSQTTDVTIKDADTLRQKAEWVAGDAT